MNREERDILWSAFFAGLIAGGVVSTIWLCIQIVSQLDIQLS